MSSNREVRTIQPAAFAVDVVLVIVFALVGRQAHGEGIDPLGVASTAWPFLVGTAVGIVVARAWRAPSAIRSGLVIWPITVAAGMLLRVATGAGVEASFVVVATIVLAVFLLGWRLAVHGIRAVAARSRTSRRAGPDRADRPTRAVAGRPPADSRKPH